MWCAVHYYPCEPYQLIATINATDKNKNQFYCKAQPPTIYRTIDNENDNKENIIIITNMFDDKWYPLS